MTQKDTRVISDYVNVYDLEADIVPKEINGWENQIILMWALAVSRNESSMLKLAIENMLKEENFSFDIFDNMYFNVDSNLLGKIFNLSLKYCRSD